MQIDQKDEKVMRKRDYKIVVGEASPVKRSIELGASFSKPIIINSKSLK